MSWSNKVESKQGFLASCTLLIKSSKPMCLMRLDDIISQVIHCVIGCCWFGGYAWLRLPLVDVEMLFFLVRWHYVGNALFVLWVVGYVHLCGEFTNFFELFVKCSFQRRQVTSGWGSPFSCLALLVGLLSYLHLLQSLTYSGKGGLYVLRWGISSWPAYFIYWSNIIECDSLSEEEIGAGFRYLRNELLPAFCWSAVWLGSRRPWVLCSIK